MHSSALKSPNGPGETNGEVIVPEIVCAEPLAPLVFPNQIEPDRLRDRGHPTRDQERSSRPDEPRAADYDPGHLPASNRPRRRSSPLCGRRKAAFFRSASGREFFAPPSQPASPAGQSSTNTRRQGALGRITQDGDRYSLLCRKLLVVGALCPRNALFIARGTTTHYARGGRSNCLAAPRLSNSKFSSPDGCRAGPTKHKVCAPHLSRLFLPLMDRRGRPNYKRAGRRPLKQGLVNKSSSPACFP